MLSFPSSNWPNTVAHCDADCFYASCELARNPSLRGKPVCILSSQDACIVAKTYDAKAMGITTGMAVWEAKKKLPDAHYLSADFAYYGQISNKMFEILRRFSPRIEVYSIDEGFIDLNGVRGMWHKSQRELADLMRAEIQQEIGITVSVGISLTKTLAKIASEMNKPNGSTIIPGRRIARYLTEFPVSDIPGIGKNRNALLSKYDIKTASDLVHAPQPLVQTMLGITGLQLQQELSGKTIWPLETKAPLPKSMSRTASMGKVISDRSIIESHLYTHGFRLVGELVAKGLAMKKLRIFLRLKSFDVTTVRFVFPIHVQSLQRVNEVIAKALNQIFDPMQEYRACGLIADDLIRATSRQQDLFGVLKQDQRQGALFQTVQEINGRYGNRTVKAGKVLDKLVVRRFKYPVIEVE